MSSNQTNPNLWPCLSTLRSISWSFPCFPFQLSGLVILLISVACFTFNLRFLFFPHRQNTLVISLSLASISVIITNVPGVLIQLFTCHRHCSQIYCRIEGFISYLSGCLCMLIFMLLSIHRYVSLCSSHRFCSFKWSTALCWFLSILVTLPLLFDYWNSYVPEGLGFHCSINWQDRSNSSRLYILVSFILMYFLPLIILFLVNCRAHLVIRTIYSKHYLNTTFLHYSSPSTSSKYYRKFKYFPYHHPSQFYVFKATDRKRFRMDYRFLRAAICLVSSYLIAWTPYSILAILQLLNIQWIFQQAVLITLTALVAKFSVILAPFVYLSIMNNRLCRRLLFQ